MSLALSQLSAHRLQTQVQRMLRNAGGGAMFRFGPEASWADTAMTTPATLGGGVAAVSDLSGFGNHMFQATSTARPALAQVGGFYAAAFDGVDDIMATAVAFDLKAGLYLATASAFGDPGGVGSELGVFGLEINTSNYFRIGQSATLGRSFAGSRGSSATPSAVANTSVKNVANTTLTQNVPYINSAKLRTSDIAESDSNGVETTQTAAPFGANSYSNSNLLLRFCRGGTGPYLYPETVFGAVFCIDYTKVDDAVVRAWLRSISGAS
jgi:hypothetical protein